MAAKIYYDQDADLNHLKGKTVAIIGYGSQGHAHAQNLRDSGVQVVVGQRPGGKNYDLAVSARLQARLRRRRRQSRRRRQHPRPRRAPRRPLPRAHRAPNEAGQNPHVLPRLQRPLRLCQSARRCGYTARRPERPGHLVRSEFVAGGGVPCLIATSEGASPATFNIGMAYAKGIGGTRGGVIHTSIAEETETDLFGEQAVLCGGACALVKAGFETLVEAGYQPEMAYFECMHELKLIVDLFYQGGLNYMRYSVSNTAEYGDYTRGPRIITAETKAEMKRILTEVQDGTFAKEWIAEAKSGGKNFKAFREKDKNHGVEVVGRKLRKLMSWINSKEVD